jgi:hypothetical protein
MKFSKSKNFPKYSPTYKKYRPQAPTKKLGRSIQKSYFSELDRKFEKNIHKIYLDVLDPLDSCKLFTHNKCVWFKFLDQWTVIFRRPK